MMGGIFGSGSNASQPVVLTGIQVQTSVYGMCIQLVYGQARIAGNLIWCGDFQSHSQSSGGKGAGGDSKGGSSYTYTTAAMIGLCEGSINGIASVWNGSTRKTMANLGLTAYLGTIDQTVWGYLTTNHPTQALPYHRLAYVAGSNINLGSSAAIPNITFEIEGLCQNVSGKVDCDPADFVTDFLTNASHGVGFAYLGDMTAFSNYCRSANLLISPVLNSQQGADQTLQDMLDTLNSALLWSDGILKIIPYGDTAISGNDRSFTPNVTALVNLTDDDFIYTDGEDPIKITRKRAADAYNDIQIEFLNRSEQYNPETVEAKDQNAIELYGVRSLQSTQMHWFCNPMSSQFVAQLRLQRELYILNTYKFDVSWKHIDLEPMDLISLSESRLGLVNQMVQITEIEEDDQGKITITADEWELGLHHAHVMQPQLTDSYINDTHADPGDVAVPLFFEPPSELTNGKAEIWICLAGQNSSWGGCIPNVSSNGTAYRALKKFDGLSIFGILTADYPTGSDPDNTNILEVDTTVSMGEVPEGDGDPTGTLTTTDAILWVDGEIIFYYGVHLTDLYKYTFDNPLSRGNFNTPIGDHALDSSFCYIGGEANRNTYIYRYPYNVKTAMEGKSLYFKFPSFNNFGKEHQKVSEVTEYSFSPSGLSIDNPKYWLKDESGLAVSDETGGYVLTYGKL